MMQKLDLESWPRRDHFHFFRHFDNPFFNVGTTVDVTELRASCRAENGPSFFLASVFLCLRAANEVEELRYRIRGQEVVVHEQIHGGSTVLRDDETFGFAYFEIAPDFRTFADRASRQIERVRRVPAKLVDRPERDDLVHLSVLPWIRFTSFSHARRWAVEDSTPKIVFGRYHPESERWLMPISIEVHHSLVDGLHVGRFLELFQGELDSADRLGLG